jgi:hypothetical protein
MLYRRSIGAIAVATALANPAAHSQPIDSSKYPALAGQWVRIGGAQWDPNKPRGHQEAPLTAEYQAVFEKNSKELFSGGETHNPQINCLPGGMPRMMIVYEPMQIILTPETTYIWVEQMGEFRRIYTDGRGFPEHPVPSFRGTSIGTWTDPDADGRYHTLAVETRSFKGPRTFDADGMPLHSDNRTIVKERIHLDGADANLLRDEITTFDHALAHPWTVARTYRRELNPVWPEDICQEDNHHVNIGPESYFVSDDGYLMPTRRGQPGPDLRNFEQPGQ